MTTMISQDLALSRARTALSRYQLKLIEQLTSGAITQLEYDQLSIPLEADAVIKNAICAPIGPDEDWRGSNDAA